MATTNRAALLTKTHKVLKKHYEPVSPPADRTLLEHILYACCLEGASYQAADDAFARLQESYFDWNEVRVTTVAELAEVMSPLPDATNAAQRLKGSLQTVFEAYYSFEIDDLKKQNIGKALKELGRLRRLTSFCLAYVNQNGLGGHAIPTNAGVLQTLVVLGVVSESEANQKRVPGMERAIPKTKGVEFGSLLHQLGNDYAAAAFSPRIRGILLEIAPDAKERFPKRATPKKETKVAAKKKTAKVAAKQDPPKKSSPKKKPAKKSATTKRLAKKKPR